MHHQNHHQQHQHKHLHLDLDLDLHHLHHLEHEHEHEHEQEHWHYLCVLFLGCFFLGFCLLRVAVPGIRMFFFPCFVWCLCLAFGCFPYLLQSFGLLLAIVTVRLKQIAIPTTSLSCKPLQLQLPMGGRGNVSNRNTKTDTITPTRAVDFPGSLEVIFLQM